jgi:hypothetical protein
MRAMLDSIGLDQWGGLLEMSECADVVKVSAMSPADLVAIGIPQDASRAIRELTWFLPAVRCICFHCRLFVPRFCTVISTPSTTIFPLWMARP